MEVIHYIEIDLSDETMLRFSDHSPAAVAPAIPSLRSVSFAPSVIAPGESMGEREKVTVQLFDHQYAFEDSTYELGTLWGKIRARYPNLRGKQLRVIRGEASQAIVDMEYRFYEIDSASYGNDDQITITAKDPLKQLDGTRAQAPDVAQGRLDAGIDSDDMSLTLTPSGVGDAFYRSAGLATVGGKEIVEYTRSGDSVTLVTRALHGTEAVAHDADAAFQEVLEFNTGSAYEIDEADFNAAFLFVPDGYTWNGGLAAEIMAYLIVKYAKVVPGRIPLDQWYQESTRAYRAAIATPEAVKTLIDELIQQAGMTFWYDSLAQKLRLRSLLNFSGTNVYDASRIVAGSYSARDQLDKQVSQAWCYWGRGNPLKRLDERENYRSIQVSVASTEYPDDFSEDDAQSIRTIYARWIDTQANAQYLTRLLIARYADPPREFNFDIYRADPGLQPALADRCQIGHWTLQDATGAEVLRTAQVVSLEPQFDRCSVVAQETIIRPFAEAFARIVYIDTNAFNVNLRDLHDAQYTPAESGDEITFIVVDGATVGSHSTTVPACDVGDWPDGVVLTLRLEVGGRIQGMGGNGGWAIVPSNVLPGAGGPALYTREPITIINNGKIFGGGGGGGRGGNAAGGGGAGTDPGPGFPGHPLGYGSSAAGTADAGGAGGVGGSIYPAGDGGDPGEPGEPLVLAPPDDPQVGGAAGTAVDGVSYVTFDVTGDVRGPQIN